MVLFSISTINQEGTNWQHSPVAAGASSLLHHDIRGWTLWSNSNDNDRYTSETVKKRTRMTFRWVEAYHF